MRTEPTRSPDRRAVHGLARSMAKSLTGAAAALLGTCAPQRGASEDLCDAWREVGEDLRASMEALPLDVAAAEHARRCADATAR